MSSYSLPLDNDADQPETAAAPRAVTGGNPEPPRWVVVERTMGLLPAQIIADRLQSEGIPARAWQEGAGQALGLTVGILGAGHVMVPQEFVAQALAVLAEEWDVDEGEDADAETDPDAV